MVFVAYLEIVVLWLSYDRPQSLRGDVASLSLHYRYQGKRVPTPAIEKKSLNYYGECIQE